MRPSATKDSTGSACITASADCGAHPCIIQAELWCRLACAFNHVWKNSSDAYLRDDMGCEHANVCCCSVWPVPPWTFFGGPVMRLHVIFGFEDTPEGKKINYQVYLNAHADIACNLALEL